MLSILPIIVLINWAFKDKYCTICFNKKYYNFYSLLKSTKRFLYTLDIIVPNFSLGGYNMKLLKIIVAGSLALGLATTSLFQLIQ